MAENTAAHQQIIDLIDSFAKGDFTSGIAQSGTGTLELNSIAERLNNLGQALAASKQKLDTERFFIRSVLNNIPTDIAVFDSRHNYLFLNKYAVADEEMRTWMIGKNDFDYFKRKGADNAAAHKRRVLFNEAVAAKTDVTWVDEHVTKEGHIKYILRKFHPVFENELLQYVIGYGLDITDIKAAENEKTKLINELSHKNNDLMQFNYIVSHNLRGPISSLIGLSDLINLPAVSGEEKKQIIENIRISALKMDALLKDLSLLLSNSSTLNNHKEDIDIKELILNITDTFKNEITQSKTVIHIGIADDAKNIYSIKNYVESILYNLITNAIKYKAAERTPEIYLETKKENGHLILKIKDNGIGINLAAHGKHMFGLYKRFNLDTEGKGLGLHMTKTQAEALGGQISIESELDKGTVFTVRLPLN